MDEQRKGEPRELEPRDDRDEGHFEDEAPPRRRERSADRPLLGTLARKFLNTGADVLNLSEEALRDVIQDAKIPREAVAGLVEQALRSKEELQTQIAKETRRQLEKLDIRDEIAKMLADYSLEVTARINFVPRDDDDDDEDDDEERRPKKSRRRPEDVKVRLRKRSKSDDE